MRAVPEWIGKTDDEAIPTRVKLRIWSREGGRCSLTGRKIMPGEKYEFEHRIALCNGGEHRESNIVLVLAGKVHREKTARDVALKSKIQRIRAAHLGVKPKPSRGLSHPTLKRKVSGQVVARSGENER
jgi:5-methylcytosine-specific restriction enzyme A